MRYFSNSLIHDRKYKKVRQVGILYSSMFISMTLGILVSVINTRFLGPQLFGDFKFLQRFFSFGVIFMTFGVFVSGGRLLAQNKNDRMKRSLMGTLFICASIISLIFITTLFCFSFFQDDLFKNKLGSVIRIFSPLLFVYPFRLCLEKILQGDERINELSIFRTGPSFLYAVSAIIFHYFFPLTLVAALTINLLSLSGVILATVVWLKPEFQGFTKHIRLIFHENKTNGFPVYVGTIAGVATNNFGEISIGYFMENVNVGFFCLAIAITRPLTMIPLAVGTTFYKDFTNKSSIPARITVITFLTTFSALMLYYFLIENVIFLLYPVEYAPVVPLAYYLATSSLLCGFGEFYNKFISAHGRGTDIRNASFVLGVSNILGYFLLVKYFGVMGAVTTHIVSASIYFLLRYYIYRRVVTSSKHILTAADKE